MSRGTSKPIPIHIDQLKDTPLGNIWLASTGSGLVAVHWVEAQDDAASSLMNQFNHPVVVDKGSLADAARQIEEYLHGKRRTFDLEIDWSMMRPFQQKVLKVTIAIPYGKTRTYGEIAQLVGNPRAARAVGQAQATNPMPLVIPCHRVIGADGKLLGYGAGQGLPTKEWLLKLEGVFLT